MSERMLQRVERGSSMEVVAKILVVLLPDGVTILDTTFGHGGFWTPEHLPRVTGIDLNPSRARDVCADYTKLPFSDESFDICVFDPPYRTDAGKDSILAARFGSYPTVEALEVGVRAGVREAWRVARVGIVVKVMEYIHASRLVRMTRWVEDEIPIPLYDYVLAESPSKVEDRRWREPQLSVRSTACHYLVWRKDGAVHRRHTPGMVVRNPRRGENNADQEQGPGAFISGEGARLEGRPEVALAGRGQEILGG